MFIPCTNDAINTHSIQPTLSWFMLCTSIHLSCICHIECSIQCRVLQNRHISPHLNFVTSFVFHPLVPQGLLCLNQQLEPSAVCISFIAWLHCSNVKNIILFYQFVFGRQCISMDALLWKLATVSLWFLCIFFLWVWRRKCRRIWKEEVVEQGKCNILLLFRSDDILDPCMCW